MSGFVPAPGTDFSYGQEPAIAARLDTLAKTLGVTIYGISGHRTPAHSVAVGGNANDPHTQGLAADIGVNSQLRSTAAQITDKQLASVGLYRPFGADIATDPEVNHIQLMPGVAPPGKTGGIPDQIANAALAGPKSVLNAGKDVAGGVKSAADLTSAVVGFLSDPVPALLTVALVTAGALLVYSGIGRILGYGTPVKSTLGKAGKAAAIGAVA